MSGMFQFFSDHADKIPFAVAAAGNHQPKVTAVRIIESVIIAAIIGAMGYFLMVPRVVDQVKTEIQYQRRDIDNNTRKIEEVGSKVDDLRRQVDRAHGRDQWGNFKAP